MSTESMTWAGPLPPGDVGGDAVEVMTFAGPLAVVEIEQQAASQDGPMMWAGPLPPWMDRAPAKARVVAAFASAV
jgi:hypothetical protein